MAEKYAYDFDYIHREYIIRCLKPFFAGPSALDRCYHEILGRDIARICQRQL